MDHKPKNKDKHDNNFPINNSKMQVHRRLQKRRRE